MSDAALLASTARGDRGAFRAFVLRHRAPAWRYARLLTRSDADAEDVLQSSFLAAYGAAGGFLGEDSARGWFLTIVRHTAVRNGRLRAGQPARHADLEDLAAEAGFATDDDPERWVSARERRAVLARALDSLPLEDQEVLVLRELEGMSGDEVAASLGLTLAAMKSRLHRARLRLLAAVRKEAPDAD